MIKMRPLTYIEIELKPRLEIKIGKIKARLKLFNFANYVRFNGIARAYFTAMQGDQNDANTIFAYGRLVNWMKRLIKRQNWFVNSIKLRKYLMGDVEAGLDLYAQIDKYNNLLKKKIALILLGPAGPTTGELSTLACVTADGLNGKSVGPRF